MDNAQQLANQSACYISYENKPCNDVQYLCFSSEWTANGRCSLVVWFIGKISGFKFFFFFIIRLMLGSGCTSGTWEPIRVQQPLLSMGSTSH